MIVMERPRMYFDTDDRLQWALRLEAADRNIPSIAKLVRMLIEEAVSARLAEVDRRVAKGESPATAKSKAGRKPKPRD